ncbi:thiamine phosphate synthase [Rhizobium leguminosarum]|uniref:ThiF family adenylyltransferase n=1 Tax=Rhizobium leguminosarum TaxID=384 RepID=UPI000FF4F15B|nr:ThiF family adenylyltransferase [Rhizobium leguminosarum]RWY83317.1 thiamine phosphate synthase [Rhizobium leguminosarum]
MVNYWSKRLSAAASESVDFPNLVTHSLGRGGRGALFTGNSADSVEEQSPHATRPAFVVSLKALDMPAEDEYDSAAVDHHDAFLAPLRHRQRDFAGFGEIDFVIIGCGGLGSQIAIQLAAHGARHFYLVDADRIDEDNLNHVPWASEADLGRLKTDKLATCLAACFSANVFALPEFAEGAAALRLIADYAHNPFVVLAGDDSHPAQEFLTACHASKAGLPPHLHVGRSQAHGMAGPSVAVHEDACPVCHCTAQVATDDGFLAPPAAAENAFIAGLAVSRIAQKCLSRHSAARGRRWILDLKSNQADLRSLCENPECKVCP